jgi:hypothetical protein
MNRISASIITLNEEHHLPRLLESLHGIADELVVVDAGSTDRTLEVAKAAGAKVQIRAWTSYSEQKNFAAQCAENSWILSLDADEQLSPELKQSILAWKQRVPQFDVYKMARRTFYLGAWIKHSGWYPDYQRRLYRRGAARFEGIVHESLRSSLPVGRLEGDLLHYTVGSFAEHEQKVDRYSDLAAEQLYKAGKRSSLAAVWLLTPWSWFQNFFLRGGFLDGYRGAVIAQMAARSVRLKYTKLRKLQAGARR